MQDINNKGNQERGMRGIMKNICIIQFSINKKTAQNIKTINFKNNKNEAKQNKSIGLHP